MVERSPWQLSPKQDSEQKEKIEETPEQIRYHALEHIIDNSFGNDDVSMKNEGLQIPAGCGQLKVTVGKRNKIQESSWLLVSLEVGSASEVSQQGDQLFVDMLNDRSVIVRGTRGDERGFSIRVNEDGRITNDVPHRENPMPGRVRIADDDAAILVDTVISEFQREYKERSESQYCVPEAEEAKVNRRSSPFLVR